ncbi:MAG: nucleotidyltransferase domain-containing protein [Fimbriimonadaceae bacterium]|nr:nucleotidyltransferase domain-containing protein [Fimbriimonadaceae bacterium]
MLRAIVDGLRTAFDVRSVVLFGSRARGEASPDSDYDVLAEVDSRTEFWERQREAQALFRRRSWSMDLIVMTSEEVGRNRAIPGSAIYWALRDGVTVYERDAA